MAIKEEFLFPFSMIENLPRNDLFLEVRARKLAAKKLREEERI